MTKYNVRINGKNYEVDVADLGGGNLEIKLGGKTVNLSIEEVLGVKKAAPSAPKPKVEVYSAPEPAPQPQATASKGKGEVIKAVMAGTVLSHKKKVGDSVSVGDVVLILEAMKMENEISSPIAGKILEIRVNPGQSINSGDALFVIG
ncbi:MAG: Pyruvate carboxylase subunit B [Candidatus Methanofastidiosum methylothiophilum]|uniref:Pyruvate carboxylase subunit B n=1 Tax=Candidatus Methanofastidiosum methylothiophilum TaxID=1705564 RepID=A0A150IHY3_9EURY|nr:MAG: Pyruvate carboxylase subunit B [Candidatus Methanofastidiosum methylthiophilus]KYC46951.1 MAG: Pyruvate carboxylase subunit B [Candidatus Methanofastidiosum methylthiophilus]KYC49182.1 MAG: Pyruvate carboxylase subunit B [Candidatus Methanofastidiosum methylthiophilus]